MCVNIKLSYDSRSANDLTGLEPRGEFFLGIEILVINLFLNISTLLLLLKILFI